MMRNFSFLLLVSVIFIGCKKDNVSATATYFFSEFENVRIEKSFNAILIEDSVHKVEIVGTEDNISKVNLSVVNQELSIFYDGKMKFLKPKEKITVRIYAPNFSIIHLSGAVELSNEGELKSPNLRINCEEKGNSCNLYINNKVFTFLSAGDGGDYTFSGQTSSAKFVYYDMIKINAKNLSSELIKIRSHSILDAEFYSSNIVHYSINNDGNVIVYGNPKNVNYQLDKNHGAGELIIK